MNQIGSYDHDRRAGTLRHAPHRTLGQMIGAVEDAIRDTERRYMEAAANPFSDPTHLIIQRDNLIAAVALIESIELDEQNRGKAQPEPKRRFWRDLWDKLTG